MPSAMADVYSYGRRRWPKGTKRKDRLHGVDAEELDAAEDERHDRRAQLGRSREPWQAYVVMAACLFRSITIKAMTI